MKRTEQAATLTIAGSDSGGGAGIQADLKTFASLGVHGTSVITCVTAQNPKAVLDVHPCPPGLVRRQLQAVFAELPPAAVKTGMLFSAAIIRAVVDFLGGRSRLPLIVDPVMVATAGASLQQSSALAALCGQLLELAALVTPNLHEAQVLTKRTLNSAGDLPRAAHKIHRRYGCAVLIKGGHLPGCGEAVDFYYDGTREFWLHAPLIPRVRTHGTGCTLSAAIAAYCALGCQLPDAVKRAKEYITQAIGQHQLVNRHPVLNHFWAFAPARHNINLLLHL